MPKPNQKRMSAKCGQNECLDRKSEERKQKTHTRKMQYFRIAQTHRPGSLKSPCEVCLLPSVVCGEELAVGAASLKRGGHLAVATGYPRTVPPYCTYLGIGTGFRSMYGTMTHCMQGEFTFIRRAVGSRCAGWCLYEGQVRTQAPTLKQPKGQSVPWWYKPPQIRMQIRALFKAPL